LFSVITLIYGKTQNNEIFIDSLVPFSKIQADLVFVEKNFIMPYLQSIFFVCGSTILKSVGITNLTF